jgi:hypothetical protein
MTATDPPQPGVQYDDDGNELATHGIELDADGKPVTPPADEVVSDDE